MSDFRTTEGKAPPLTRRERARRRLKMAAWIGGAVVAAIAAGALVQVPQEVAANGYVTSEVYAEVRPPAAGTVSRILVASGDAVRAGDLMAQLEDGEERAVVAESTSRLARVEAECALAEAETAQAKRDHERAVREAAVKLAHASARVRQLDELSRRGLASEQALEDARMREQLASLEVEGLASRDLAVLDRRQAVQRAGAAVAREAAALAQARLANRQVRAPIAGRALRYEFVVGELVRPEMVLYEVFGGDRSVLKLRVPERYATRVQPGQGYRALLQPYRGVGRVWFSGRVESLRGVIQSESGRSYRVAYCTFDASGWEVPPGTTAEAWVDAGRVSFWRRVAGF